MFRSPYRLAEDSAPRRTDRTGRLWLRQTDGVIPEPESQLTPKPGLLTDDNGEWVIYRKP